MTKKNNLRVGLGIPIGKAKKRIRRIIETYLMEENGKPAVPVIYRRPPIYLVLRESGNPLYIKKSQRNWESVT